MSEQDLDPKIQAEIDARLRAAFGNPPDPAPMLERLRAPRRPIRRTWLAAATAAAVLAASVLAFALWAGPDDDDQDDPTAIDAVTVWKQLDPIFQCQPPRIADDKQFATHCVDTHGSSLCVKTREDVSVHGPTRYAALPGTSVFTVVFRPKLPGAPSDVRAVLLGRRLAIRSTDEVRAFHRELHGLQMYELSRSGESRALTLFY